jgi:predicted permease
MVRHWIEDFWNDLRHGGQMLRDNTGFTVVAVIALALGIGANAAIFSVVNAVLIKPLPYSDPQRLAWVTTVLEGDEVTGADVYLHWKEQSKAFAYLVAFGAGLTKMTGGGEPENLEAVFATADVFPVLGITPQFGRAFTPEEDRDGGAPVVILSHSLWERRFGGAPDIIGKPLVLDGESRTVIGIMPSGFRFIREGSFLGEVQVLMPLGLDVQKELQGESTSIIGGGVIGRINPSVTIEQSRSELYTIEQNLEQAHPAWPHLQVRVIPLGERLVGHLRHGLLVLFSAVGFVLLIACTNVANLMLARGAMLQKEMAIRAALGAGRLRLVRQLLTETLVLAVLGGMAGLLLAMLAVDALVRLTPDNMMQLKDSSVDNTVIGFTLLISLLTSVIAGVIPALQTSRIDLNTSLKESASSSGALKRRGPWSFTPVLVIGELALTLVLLIGAGLLIKSFVRLRAVEPGYNPENLLTMMTALNNEKYPPGSPGQKLAYQDLLERIKAIPGVKAAATGSSLPMTEGPLGICPLEVEGRPPIPEPQKPQVEYGNVSPDYFRVMQMQMRAGRGFTEQDNENAQNVVVINETMAQRHFAGENPLGKRILFGSPNQWRTIIGVMADVRRYGLKEEVRSEFYVPSLQDHDLTLIKLVVRTAGNPTDWAGAVRQQIRAGDPDQEIWDVMTMEQRLAESVAPRRFQMLLFSALAALALLLTVVGVYGVISHWVGRRAHELGIRMALGAAPGSVVLMVIRQGMLLALAGVVIGVVAALALGRVMEGLLFSVKSTDPATFAGISLLLLTGAFLAAYLPARRAIKVDPVAALRHE